VIEYLRGKLVAVFAGEAILEVGSMGLSLEIPASPEGLEQLVGTEVLFYTRLLFREDDLRLIGFRTAEERNLFNLITGVSGFGPRLGLALPAGDPHGAPTLCRGFRRKYPCALPGPGGR